MDKAWVSATLDAIGRFGKGEHGYSRLVFGDAESGAVEYVAGVMRSVGLAVRTDAFGNVIGRLEGREAQAPAVATGSHLDTVPEGGNFDGVVGVVAGLGAVLRLKQSAPLRHPLEVIVFRGEESSRFSVGTLGSKAMAGIAVDWPKLRDQGGTTLSDALAARGLGLDRIAEAKRRKGEIKAYVEMHIEQGPVLEDAGIPIGIVEAIAAPIRLRVVVEGMASHSGTTPMDKRRDALVAASRLVLAVQDVATKLADRRIVATVGVMKVLPGAINVVPGRVEMLVDVRGIEVGTLEAAARAVREAADAVAQQEHVSIHIETVSTEIPVPMDAAVVRAIEDACGRLGVRYQRMPSGAGHDAMNMATIAPAGMIFIPCRNGISHNPAEFATPEAICTGMDVLTEALRTLAA